VKAALALQKKNLRGANVLLIGIAYKANVDDDRESPAYALWKLLEAHGAKVSFHDPHISQIRPSREHSQFAGRKGVSLTPKNISAADVVLIATPHNAVNWSAIAKNAKLVVDTRNVLAKSLKNSSKYFKA
jgi:UDP-N-acetyl-D-glucosamine dehydrogenase